MDQQMDEKSNLIISIFNCTIYLYTVVYSLISQGLMGTFLRGLFSCFSMPAIAAIAIYISNYWKQKLNVHNVFKTFNRLSAYTLLFNTWVSKEVLD